MTSYFEISTIPWKKGSFYLMKKNTGGSFMNFCCTYEIGRGGRKFIIFSVHFSSGSRVLNGKIFFMDISLGYIRNLRGKNMAVPRKVFFFSAKFQEMVVTLHMVHYPYFSLFGLKLDILDAVEKGVGFFLGACALWNKDVLRIMFSPGESQCAFSCDFFFQLLE